jgi:hypothetical protein
MQYLHRAETDPLFQNTIPYAPSYLGVDSVILWAAQYSLRLHVSLLSARLNYIAPAENSVLRQMRDELVRPLQTEQQNGWPRDGNSGMVDVAAAAADMVQPPRREEWPLLIHFSRGSDLRFHLQPGAAHQCMVNLSLRATPDGRGDQRGHVSAVADFAMAHLVIDKVCDSFLLLDEDNLDSTGSLLVPSQHLNDGDKAVQYGVVYDDEVTSDAPQQAILPRRWMHLVRSVLLVPSPRPEEEEAWSRSEAGSRDGEWRRGCCVLALPAQPTVTAEREEEGGAVPALWLRIDVDLNCEACMTSREAGDDDFSAATAVNISIGGSGGSSAAAAELDSHGLLQTSLHYRKQAVPTLEQSETDASSLCFASTIPVSIKVSSRERTDKNTPAAMIFELAVDMKTCIIDDNNV